ncbi:diguanylate cyclase domain-containing protein [Pseudomonas putida]|uniref:diguanylate cyclase domain-containing protein n=1 Tax=Pseudomonas putida TaxID=303 RepID=UPI001E38B7FB|nr:diguanylate cyclase [Pseudomonas putida]MCC9005665.1 diguanylate cyclase [Pseudomonas putida]
MTLRTKLLWLFAPPLLLVLGLTYIAVHTVLLDRLDTQDERLLAIEAGRVRALLNNLFERDADRLGQLAESLPRPIASAFPLQPGMLNRTGFDFLFLVTPGGPRSVWRPIDLATISDTVGNKPLSLPSLQAEVSAQIDRVSRSMVAAPAPQLMVVDHLPVILVAIGAGPSGARETLFAGRFLDAERIAGLERQLGAVLRWAASGVPLTASLTDGHYISIGNRQISDERHQRIELIFHNSLGEPQVQLQLRRERHLYSEGLQLLKYLMGAMAAIIGLAWLLIYLALDVTLLRRISILNREFLAIGADSASGRLSDSGHDELGMLAQQANRTLERLEQSEARARVILDGMEDGYFELDEHARIQSVNPAFCKMLGYDVAQVTGRTFASLQQQQHGKGPSTRVVFDTEPGAPLSARLQRADGTAGYYETRFTRIIDPAGNVSGYRGILHDVSEHVQYQQALLDMAYRDALTGLGNRKAFHQQLERSLGAQRLPLGVLFLDLDRFKQVNDRFGHDVGDALLVCMAERLRNAMRKQDMAYRLGGDEFTAILPVIDETAAGALAERLLAALSAPVSVGGVLIDFVTPSIGLAFAPAHGTSASMLVKAADQAMYQAKQKRGRVCLAS